ncbi:MAG: hypothetical protein HOY69_15360 [Streptomyces sp.]|nr:hypothetical protein [Streptomyces sp.]
MGVAVLCAALGLYGLYYVSPFGRHDRQAAAYERRVRAQVLAVGDVRVVSARHQVNGDLTATSSYCSFVVTFEVETALRAEVFESALKARLHQQRVDFVYENTAPSADRAGGRRLLRVVVGTLGEGGSLDLRCG